MKAKGIILMILVTAFFACQREKISETPSQEEKMKVTEEAIIEGGKVVRLSDVSYIDVAEGHVMKVITGKNIMVSFVELAPDKSFAMHNHPAEQMTYILEGEIDVTIGKETHHMKSGDLAIIPSNVIHQGKTGNVRCMFLDVFSPPREEFMEDAVK